MKKKIKNDSKVSNTAWSLCYTICLLDVLIESFGDTLVPLSSCGSAWMPVDAPVMMTPSDRKNCAARAVSSMLTSDVRAWELQQGAHGVEIVGDTT